MARFDVLTAQRAIRDDRSLTGPQVGLLLCATLRADSRGAEPGRVRASLELLAKDAKVSDKTAQRAFREDPVVRYFARVERQTRSVGLWFHPTPERESAVTPPDSGLSVRNGHPTPDSLSTTPDSESDHLPLPLAKPASKETAPMDDATWLAAELDADPAACRAAIDHKRQQAHTRGRPWVNITRMVRSVIPLDEWRQALEQQPKPRPKPNLSGECDGTNCPGTKHVVEHDDHRVICWGVAPPARVLSPGR